MTDYASIYALARLFTFGPRELNADGMSRTKSVPALPAICSSCHAAPALIAVETNGLSTRCTLCGPCFAARVAEQRIRRVTPIGGVPLAPLPLPHR